MQVCSLFLKIIKKNIGLVILYMVIFTFVTVLMLAGFNTSNEYSESKVKTYVVVEEENKETLEFLEFLDNSIERVELSINLSIEDGLFWNDFVLYLNIPKNFYQRLLEGKEDILIMKSTPDSMEAYTVIETINRYFTYVKENIRLGLCEKENALNYTSTLFDEKITDVSLVSDNGTEAHSAMFNTGVYVICALTLLIIGLVSFEMRTTDISRRFNVAPLPIYKRNGMLTICYVALCFVFVGIISLVGIIVFKEAIYAKIGYYILNICLFSLTMVCFALFLSSMFKSGMAFNCVAVILPLASAFICGSFVGLELLPSYTLALGHIFPNYYIVLGNNYINTCTTFQFIEYLKNVWPCFIFIVIFTVGTILVSKLQARSEN